MTINSFNPAGLPDGTPLGMAQAASAHGRLVAVSGQVAMDENGNIVGVGDIEAQATRAFENVRIALEAAGASLDDVVRLGVYISDGNYLAGFREVRKRFLREPYPAATGVVAGLVHPDLLIEIDALAVVAD